MVASVFAESEQWKVQLQTSNWLESYPPSLSFIDEHLLLVGLREKQGNNYIFRVKLFDVDSGKLISGKNVVSQTLCASVVGDTHELYIQTEEHIDKYSLGPTFEISDAPRATVSTPRSTLGLYCSQTLANEVHLLTVHIRSDRQNTLIRLNTADLSPVASINLPGSMYLGSTVKSALLAAASGVKLFNNSGELITLCSDCSGRGGFLDDKHIVDIPANHKVLRILDLQAKQTGLVHTYGAWVTEAHNGTFAILAVSEHKGRSVATLKLARTDSASTICDQPTIRIEHNEASTNGDWAVALAPDVHHVAIYTNGMLTVQKACSSK